VLHEAADRQQAEEHISSWSRVHKMCQTRTVDDGRDLHRTCLKK